VGCKALLIASQLLFSLFPENCKLFFYGGSCIALRQAQGERECSLILLGISVRGELVEPQIGLFARASMDNDLNSANPCWVTPYGLIQPCIYGLRTSSGDGLCGFLSPL
jgi:hypothetical protein